MRRQIGTTGVHVFPIGLGAMPLSLAGRPPEKEGIQVIHAALDAGVDFIDTANVYCLDNNDIGHNEKLITKALSTWPNRNEIYVATKGGLTRPQGSWEVMGSPEALQKSCEQSLRDLKVEQIFLYQLHAPDSDVPFEDQVEQLARLQKQGKIRHIGLSNVTARQIDVAQKIVRIESIQNRWNPLHQYDAANGVFDECRRHHMTYIAYSPVGGGHSHVGLASNRVLLEVSKKYSVSPYQIMIAWALHKGEHMLPIPGASRIASITDSIKAASIHLERREAEAIDAIGAH